MNTVLKLGTRGSPLALVQAHTVRDRLMDAHAGLEIEIVEILTSGDWKPEDGETRLKEEDGGKGQFAKEIEQALLAGEIDLAVHSMKDMETTLPEGLVIHHMLEREDPRDAMLVHPDTPFDGRIASFPAGTVIGTASVRRQAFLLTHNQNLEIKPLRGNVETRIHKLNDQQVQATLLAISGLKRLGLEDAIHSLLSVEQFLPAAGQGAVGIEIKDSRKDVAALLDAICCATTYRCVSAERAALHVLDGSCHTPIGAHAVMDGAEMYLRLKIASLDGREFYEKEGRHAIKTAQDAIDFGSALGHALKEITPASLLDQHIGS